jgi:hypothetical protein
LIGWLALVLGSVLISPLALGVIFGGGNGVVDSVGITFVGVGFRVAAICWVSWPRCHGPHRALVKLHVQALVVLEVMVLLLSLILTSPSMFGEFVRVWGACVCSEVCVAIITSSVCLLFWSTLEYPWLCSVMWSCV